MSHASNRTRSSLLTALLCFLHSSTSSKHYSQAHPVGVSVPIHHSDKKKALNSHNLRDRHTYVRIANTSTRYQVHTNTRNILMRVASVSRFPGAWRRSSWHFQVASLHLQSSVDLLFVRFTLSFLSKRSGRRMPPAERRALYHILLFLSSFFPLLLRWIHRVRSPARVSCACRIQWYDGMAYCIKSTSFTALQFSINDW